MDVRPYPKYDETRSTAIWGMGRLRSPMPTMTILEELIDSNPQVVKAAAQALERIWGVQKAIARLLEDEWSSGRLEFQECAKALLSNIGDFQAVSKLQERSKSVEEFSKHVREEECRMQELFNDAVEDAKVGFRIAQRMDIAVFAVGVMLLIVSAVMALVNNGSLESWASAGVSSGLGVLGILYSTLVAKPRRKVEQSINHLMHLQATFLGFLRQLHHVEQIYSRRMLEDELLSVAEVTELNEILSKAIDKAVLGVSKASEGYSQDNSETARRTNTAPGKLRGAVRGLHTSAVGQEYLPLGEAVEALDRCVVSVKRNGEIKQRDIIQNWQRGHAELSRMAPSCLACAAPKSQQRR
ncbi:hypothetical protein CYMTET_45812 [Cymbomonas tetramitiformis]|uniref:Uncharacterized protein n=1 Tax=Cymbomonas tetramitiformis TaxID=36881 RepID=A0AAE0EY85_9CHLO|nr:hypothetical protein CYMTET_45812 [Cymbomonas tetramitiformis]